MVKTFVSASVSGYIEVLYSVALVLPNLFIFNLEPHNKELGLKRTQTVLSLCYTVLNSRCSMNKLKLWPLHIPCIDKFSPKLAVERVIEPALSYFEIACTIACNSIFCNATIYASARSHLCTTPHRLNILHSSFAHAKASSKLLRVLKVEKTRQQQLMH